MAERRHGVVSLFDHFADAGTGANSTEQDLYSDTIAASTLLANGDMLMGHYSAQMLVHASNTRRIRVYFMGTAVFDTAALATTAATRNYFCEWRCMRVSQTIVRVSGMAMATLGTTLLVQEARYTAITPASDLTNTQIIKITGLNSGTDTDGVKATSGKIMFVPSA